MRRSLATFLLLVLAGLAPAQTGTAGTWVRHDSQTGQFTVLFPMAPKEQTETKTVSQGEIVSHIFLTSSGDFFCLAGYTDYPVDVDTEQELSMDRDNFAKAVQATVSDSRRRSFTADNGDQFPALDFVATSANGTFKSVVVLVNRRVYQAATFNRKGSDHNADMERFLASFKVTGKRS